MPQEKPDLFEIWLKNYDAKVELNLAKKYNWDIEAPQNKIEENAQFQKKPPLKWKNAVQPVFHGGQQGNQQAWFIIDKDGFSLLEGTLKQTNKFGNFLDTSTPKDFETDDDGSEENVDV